MTYSFIAMKEKPKEKILDIISHKLKTKSNGCMKSYNRYFVINYFVASKAPFVACEQEPVMPVICVESKQYL